MVQVTDDKWEETPLSWLTVGEVRLALSGFTIAPRVASEIIANRTKGKRAYMLILVPNKPTSNRIYHSLIKRHGTPFFTEPPETNESRYSWIARTGSNQIPVLILNTASGREGLDFLLDYFDNLAARLAIPPSEMVTEVLTLVHDSLELYNKNAGIPFLSWDSEVEQYALGIASAIQTCYVEGDSFKATITKSNLAGASDFVTKKLGLYFGGIKWDELWNLNGVFGLLGMYFNALSILAATQQFESVYKIAESQFQDYNNEVLRKLKEHPRIVRALGRTVSLMENAGPYESLGSFVRTVRSAFENLVRDLPAKYVWIAAAVDLIYASRDYAREIESSAGLPVVERYGGDKLFLETLATVSRKRTNPPELRIAAARGMVAILVAQIKFQYNSASYKVCELALAQFGSLVERNLQTIMDRVPRGFIDYSHVVKMHIELTMLAKSHDDQGAVKRHMKEALRFAEQYDISSMKYQLYWYEFLFTNDYSWADKMSGLGEVQEHAPLDNTERTLLHLSRALAGRAKPVSELKLAEKAALDSAIPSHPTANGAGALRASELLMNMVEMMAWLIKFEANRNSDSIKKAKTYAQSVAAGVEDTHPIMTLVSKTLIVDDVYDNKIEDAQSRLEQLRRAGENGSEAARFADLVESWVSKEPRERRARLLQTLNAQIDNRDIWYRLVYSLMKRQVKRELVKADLAGVVEVVFVEGETDRLVFEALARTLRVKRRALFLDAEGWTNMEYYANAKIAAKLGRRITVIFDGDTELKKLEKIKKVLVSRLRLSPDRVVTLSKMSIEQYLLVPRAIQKALHGASVTEEEIRAFLRSRAGKKNAKVVLDELFRTHGMGKFSSLRAQAIARYIKRHELDKELIDILRR